HKLFPELAFTSFLGDSAHDNYPTYNLLRASCVTPIIALNERHKGHYLMAVSSIPNLMTIRACSLSLHATPKLGKRHTKTAPVSNAHTNARRLISTSNKRACVHDDNGRYESS